jgi:hypothetical protein
MNPPSENEERCDVCGGEASHGRAGVKLCHACAWIVDGSDGRDYLIATIRRYPQLFDRLSVGRFAVVRDRLRERGELDRFVGLSDREAVGLALTTRGEIDKPAKPST